MQEERLIKLEMRQADLEARLKVIEDLQRQLKAATPAPKSNEPEFDPEVKQHKWF